MINFLSDLSRSSPNMWGVYFSTVLTLQIDNFEFSHKSLLNYCALKNLSLDSNLNFNHSRMRLCPNPFCVNQFHFLQPFDFLQTNCEQFIGLKLTLSPRWSIKSLTSSAMIQNKTLCDPFCDINSSFQTIDTSCLRFCRPFST